MKEVKYIPGDLIKSDRTPNAIWKVRDVSQDKRGNILYMTAAAEYNDVLMCLYEHQIIPIPLTPEILEKNGWEKSDILIDEDEDEHHLYENKKNLLNIMYVPESKRFLPFIGNQHMLTFFKYVHQLQHLLFGLGLSMDLKV